jgi:hypothetical protein
MLTPDTPARRAAAGPLCNARLLLALGFAIMFGSHLTAFSVLAQTDDLIVIKNAAGQMTARLTYDGYWGLGNAFHPNAGTISLTAGRNYWSVKSATGVVLFAIDCESGEAWSSGPANKGLNSIDPTGASFSAKNATGTTVFSISPDGAINVIGGIFDWFIQNILEPTPMPNPLPESPIWEGPTGVYARFGDPVLEKWKNVDIVVHDPESQLRICYGTPNSLGDGGVDVTAKKWRLRFQKNGGYDLHLGFRWMWDNGALGFKTFTEGDQHGQESDSIVRWSGTWTHYLRMDSCRYSVDDWPEFPIPWMYQFGMSASDADTTYAPPLGEDMDALSFVPQTALFLYDVKFFHPVKIPRKSADGEVWLGCALWPGNTPGLYSIKLKISDPTNSHMYREWTNVGSWWVVESWDGKLYYDNDPCMASYTQASDIFMEATVYFNTGFDGQPLVPAGSLVDDPFLEPNLAISIPQMTAHPDAGLELEVGTTFSAGYLTQSLGYTPTNFRWDFFGKAFRDVEKLYYLNTDLLGNVRVGNTLGRYITGGKSAVSNTDLGHRMIDFSASGNSEDDFNYASIDFDLVVNSAKITFYYTPYEWQWHTSSPTEAVSVTNGSVTQTIYVVKEFLDAAKIEGNGRLWRVRTASSQDFDSGTEPNSSQKYIWLDGSTQPAHWAFSSIAKNGMSGQLIAGDSARYIYADTYKSYYNGNGATYFVHDLGPEVNAKIDVSLSKAEPSSGSEDPYRQTPIRLSNNMIQVVDSGPFDGSALNPADPKHLDIYLEEVDTLHGISRKAFNVICDTGSNPTWESGRKVTKDDNQ